MGMTTARIEIGAHSERSLAARDSSNAALIERLRTLRSILPAMATEVAIARREGARLRRENATLRRQLAQVEGGLAGLQQTSTHYAGLESR
jgi:hypothetical protein